MSRAFVYPLSPLVRKHGPSGYANPSEYRPWLRDEFTFSCVYCLLREVWVPGGFHLDHFLPVARQPDLATRYDNLSYCCATCNLAKQDYEIPDPTTTLLASTVRVDDNGMLVAKTKDAKSIVARLALNRPSYCTFRRSWISVVRLAEAGNPALLHDILGFPVDLPDLAALRPPDGNTKPAGIEQSFFRLRERGELPTTY